MVDLGRFPRGDPGRKIKENIAPNATWLAPGVLKAATHWQYRTGKVFLGALGDTLLGVEDDRHLISIAGSRAGKGTSVIIPNLLLYPGSVLCVDPKGENAFVTVARRKALGQIVYALDPFETSGLPVASFNPLSIIDLDAETCVDDAALIADAIIIQETGSGQHFTAAARNWIRGLLLYIAAHEPPEKRHLIRLRELLTLSGTEMSGLLEAMINSEAAYGVIARAGGAIAQKEARELSGVLSTAIEQTDFLDSPPMRKVLERSDFRLTDLKTKRISVFLCLPAGRMATHNRWLRIFINLVIEAMERSGTAKEGEPPVLVIMDEFPVLGHLESIEKASGMIAGFGVRLWPIIQDLSQLKRHYKESWETFMGNAGLLQAFGNADLTTLKYLAERLGQSTVITVSKGEITQQQAANGFTGESVSQTLVPLMSADEIGQFFSRRAGAQLLLWPGSNPIAATRVEYFRHALFQGTYRERR
jgi:type IV secretion system protein VirD4